MSSSTSGNRPADAGKGVIAVANTRSAFSNIRRGPGIDYQDVGDILDNSLVVYYPDSRTRTTGYGWRRVDCEAGSMLLMLNSFMPLVLPPRRARQVPTMAK